MSVLLRTRSRFAAIAAVVHNGVYLCVSRQFRSLGSVNILQELNRCLLITQYLNGWIRRILRMPAALLHWRIAIGNCVGHRSVPPMKTGSVPNARSHTNANPTEYSVSVIEKNLPPQPIRASGLPVFVKPASLQVKG